MTKDDWKLLPNEVVSNKDESSSENTQASERKRRLLHSSKTKTHRRYIQDIVSFLQHEAEAAEEEVQYESRQVASDTVVRVTVGGDSVEARKKTVKAAKEAAAKEMMRMIGPWIEDEVWRQHSDTVSSHVPPQYQATWLPPVFDARHVTIDGEVWYEVELQLGPLSIVSVNNSLNTSLESLIKQSNSFLTSRNLDTMLKEPLEENLQEMEVFPHLNQPYVQCRDVITVRMEGGDGSIVISPVDVFTLQQYLHDGKFPQPYGAKDVFSCTKIFKCNICDEDITGSDNLSSHIQTVTHWRRLGKFFINGQLRETFCPSSEPSPQQDPDNPQLPFPHFVHPVPDQQAGRPVDTSNPQYCIAVLRCSDQLQRNGEQKKPPSLLDLNCEPAAGSPFKPPDASNRPGFGGLYDEGSNGFKSGWEDPYAPKMAGPGWDDGQQQQQQFGYGRGGYPQMGYGGPQLGYRGYGGPGHMGFGPRGFGSPQRMRFNGPGGFGGPRPKQTPASNIPAPSNPETVGMTKKITAEKKLEKYSGGEVVMPETEDSSGNEAYTGKVGKTGFSDRNKKETARYAALPPPGHSQWNNISGNENFKIDNSMANLKPVGANFKANKSGVRVCIPWKRGMCKLGDRCNYTHGDPQHNKLQSLVDASVSPLEKDLSGYRIAADVAKAKAQNAANSTPVAQQAAPSQNNTKQSDQQKETMSDDWFSDGPSEVKMRTIDQDAIMRSIQAAKHKMGGMETDFTQVKKRSKWD